MLLHHPLGQHAAATPDAEAVVCGEQRLSYAGLHRRIGRFARMLRAQGLARGDRVVLQLANSITAVVAIFGVLEAGGVAVPIDPQVRRRKRDFVLRDSGARFLVIDETATDDAGAAGGPSQTECPELVGILVARGKDPTSVTAGRVGADGVEPPGLDLAACLAAAPAEPVVCPSIDLDLCSLLYTSGSTGPPKGVMLSHRNMVTAADSISRVLALGAADRILNLSPLSFDYGLYNVLLACRAGATVILEEPFVSPQQVFGPIRRERVTGLPLVPPMIAILLRFPLERYDVSSVRYVTSTGQRLPAAHSRRLAEVFSDAEIFSMYGLTECKRVSYLPAGELARRPDSVGKAIPNTEVFLIDDDGERIDQPGEVGELVVRGSHVMEGYWGRPEESAEVLLEGPTPGLRLLRTGDLFQRDAEGFLYCVGRRDELFKSGAERIGPGEIEAVVCELPGVGEAAVYGVDDPLLGQAIHLAVVTTEADRPSAVEVLDHCRRHLERTRVPKRILLIESLPRTRTGKLDRRALAEGVGALETREAVGA